MAEISHAKRIMGIAEREHGDAEEGRTWRKGFGGDNAGGLNPFCLSLRRKDGRQSEGPSMSLFLWHYWIDDGGAVERLVLLFSVGGIYIEGMYIKRQLSALLEEGKLKYIQQHDAAEIEAIRAHNLDKRKPEEKEPIVLRILVTPDIEKRLQSDENLAVIAAAMKGEEGETGISGNAKR